MRVICISGTPGTGKSFLASVLSEKTGYMLIDVKRMVDSGEVASGHDRKRKCRTVSIKELEMAVRKKVKESEKQRPQIKGVIIDSLLSHCLPKRLAGSVIITRCEIGELKKRLVKRGYSPEKVRENLDAEILEVCISEAREKGHRPIEVDTAKGISRKAMLELLKQLGLLKHP